MNPQVNGEASYSWQPNSVIPLYLEKQRATMAQCAKYYHPDYIEGFNFLYGDGFSVDKLHQRLDEVGWKPTLVDGYLTSYEYFKHLYNRRIPVNIHVRPEKEVDFARFPDMIHDMFGHCPMLTSPRFSKFVDEISQFIFSLELEDRDHEYLGLHRNNYEDRIKDLRLIEEKEAEMKNDPTPYYYHTSLGLWTIEFGIIKDKGNVHAYGAAVVASPLEMTSISSGKSAIVSLSDSSVGSKFNFSTLQDHLYSTSSFEEIKDKIRTLA